MSDYPPYVNAYGSLSKLFDEIRKASVPPKFNQDFLSEVLGLKSSSYRAMIPLLKRLGFLDQANVPTKAYKDYRDDGLSRPVMAARLREAYAPLYAAHEYAHKLAKDQLIAKLRTVTGAGADDEVIPVVASTFAELVKLADFDAKLPAVAKSEAKDELAEKDHPVNRGERGEPLGISYTINLNLPATTEVEVFNAIFKSLREHILERQ